MRNLTRKPGNLVSRRGRGAVGRALSLGARVAVLPQLLLKLIDLGTARLDQLALSLLATAILLATGGPLAAGIGVASILFYVFVYTVWLKPRSIWNAVVGGASGAVAPLIADAAVDGSVGPAGWLLFAIIFFWQPPHVWAIALYRSRGFVQEGLLRKRININGQFHDWLAMERDV